MSISQAHLYDTNKEFAKIVKSIYEKGKYEEPISGELVLDWFTPTSIEELSTILLEYENRDKNPNLRVYHTGGAGDNGFDVIGIEDKSIKFVAQCKTTFKLEDIKSYSNRIDDTKINFYYIFTEDMPSDKKAEAKLKIFKKRRGIELWDRKRLLELIEKYYCELKNIPQYAAILNRYEHKGKCKEGV